MQCAKVLKSALSRLDLNLDTMSATIMHLNYANRINHEIIITKTTEQEVFIQITRDSVLS